MARIGQNIYFLGRIVAPVRHSRVYLTALFKKLIYINFMTNIEYDYSLYYTNLCTYLQHYSYLIIFNILNVSYTSYNYKL